MSTITRVATGESEQKEGSKVPEIVTIKTDSVVFREDLYPRIETSAATVQKYAEDLSVLPPVDVNQHNALIDGWHRWTAHKKNGVEDIAAVVIETGSDAELLELAIEKNAIHGLQMSQADKRDMARKIYTATPIDEQADKKKRLAEILSVTPQTIQNWLENTVTIVIDINEQALEINHLTAELNLANDNVRLVMNDRDRWRRENKALRAELDTINREYGIR